MSANTPLHIGTVPLDRPRIVVAATDAATDATINAALATPFDIWELRIDGFQSTNPDEVLRQIRRFNGRPRIATIRASWEGGSWRGTEKERIALYNVALPEVDAIDIEVSATDIAADLIASAANAGKTTIASYHAFDAFPGVDSLQQALHQADRFRADIAKIAAVVANETELRTLAQLTLQAAEARPIVTIAMGAIGALSRVFFPALGSRLTYTHLGEETAPGQLSLEETVRFIQRFYPT